MGPFRRSLFIPAPIAHQTNEGRDGSRLKAKVHQLSKCARYVRKAIEAGAVTIAKTMYAKDYGSRLTNAGFVAAAGAPKAGDVAVIQATEGGLEGHMAMYNGTQWVSDYNQPAVHGYYPSATHRKEKPADQ